MNALYFILGFSLIANVLISARLVKAYKVVGLLANPSQYGLNREQVHKILDIWYERQGMH